MVSIENPALDKLLENLGVTNNLIYILIGAIIVNIIIVIFKYYLDKKLKDRELFVYKRNLVANKSIKFQALIFQKIERLSLYQRDEDSLLLKDLQEIQALVQSKRLYLTKEICKCIDDLLNYYRSVLTSYSHKDFKNETQLLNEYIKKFNS